MTNLGLALLQAGGPSRTPTGIGSRLGQAGMQAMQANQGVMDRNLERMLAARKMQQDEAQRAMREQAISALSTEEQTIARLDPNSLGEIYRARLGIGGKGQAQLLTTPEAENLGLSSDVRYQRLPDGKIVPVEGTQAKRPETPKLTGSYGNLAISMFGTNDAGQLSQQQLQSIDAEARKRGLERPPSTVINMPTESERTAGFLANRLQGGLQQLRTAVGETPSAASPTLGAEAVKFVTGSDYLKNLTNPEARQRVEAAQLEILDSALTLGTGAAYTREQLLNYQKSYFPQLGDKPATVAEKQKRLENLLEAARVKAGRSAPPSSGLPPGVTVRQVQ
jgi:hypothetical protein